MLGSSTIELILGMVFIYLALSLIVSTIREGIEARLKTRSQHLARGIAQLLNTPQAADLFYRHPMVAALYPDDLRRDHFAGSLYKGERAIVSFFRVFTSFFHDTRQLPSYIPRRTFAMALLQLVARDQTFLDAAKIVQPQHTTVPDSPPGAPAPIDALAQARIDAQDQAQIDATRIADAATASAHAARTNAIAVVGAAGLQIPIPPAPTLLTEALAVLRAEVNQDNPLAKSMLAALSTCDGDIDKAVAALGAWYDGTMDRVSGWYKRESQSIMFWLGFVVAIGLNVDSIYLFKYLHSNEQARTQLVKAAESEQEQLHRLMTAKSTALADDVRNAEDTVNVAKKDVDTASPERREDAQTTLAKAATDLDAKRTAQIAALNKATADSIRRATDLQLPIGWTDAAAEDFFQIRRQTLWTIVGWFLTAFALSLGAPFWFDMLNNIMVVRSTVKPSEKSPDKAPDEPVRKT